MEHLPHVFFVKKIVFLNMKLEGKTEKKKNGFVLLDNSKDKKL